MSCLPEKLKGKVYYEDDQPQRTQRYPEKDEE
jgi:hypothetical protein